MLPSDCRWPLHVHMMLSLCVGLSANCPFSQGRRLGLRPTLMASFSLANFCKRPHLQKRSHSRGLRVKTWTYKRKRRHNSIPNSTQPATAFNYVFNREVDEHGPDSFLSPLEDSSQSYQVAFFKKGSAHSES